MKQYTVTIDYRKIAWRMTILNGVYAMGFVSAVAWGLYLNHREAEQSITKAVA